MPGTGSLGPGTSSTGEVASRVWPTLPAQAVHLLCFAVRPGLRVLAPVSAEGLNVPHYLNREPGPASRSFPARSSL